ncbi:MAG TPA: M1 family metallopeptidase [Bryobacteraceae bacterium]|nr:M1 family metallopeptidase [Bryobacteraceae bacterium]
MPHARTQVSPLFRYIPLALAVCLPLVAQRLPGNVHPEHYSLSLTPDLKTATFTGEETIEVTLAQPAKQITLNAAEITFKDVTIRSGADTQGATVSVDPDKEQAVFEVANTIPAGRATIHIRYTGILNNELRGFYLSKTPTRNYAVTQFEPTDARRAFPCFDEPSYKAIFSVTLVVDIGDTAISNTNIIYDRPGPVATKHTIKFATTPKMSTYLVAFLVGDFQCVSGQSEGIPIRACATPGKQDLGKFAVSAAEFVLRYYDNYFGIRYPLPKLDLVAIPDFEAGAMENFGCITYRETDLLIDEKTASIRAKENVAEVVAHEMAHQWFGDLVTMQWWNNLWLNEGFATWMETKPVAVWHPEWNVPQQDARELSATMNYDAQKVTRPIRSQVETPAQINEQFDPISYGKAGGILAMVENYLGEETFRRGVHNYLEAHLYANATAEDFWNAQTKTSGKPVDKIMSSFVAQPGVPLLTFSAPGKDSVAVREQRFYLSSSMNSDTNQTWTIPVCFKKEYGNDCELVTSPQQTLPVPSGPIFFADAGAMGYYRTNYPPEVRTSIAKKADRDLTPPERIAFTSDQWALTVSGRGNVGDYLNLVSDLRDDPNAGVISEATGAVVTVNDRIATDDDRKRLAGWVDREFKPPYEKIHLVRSDDTPNRIELRGDLFSVLGDIGEDPAVIAESRDITERWLKNQASVEPTLATAARTVASTHGDATLYDQLVQLYKTSQDPIVRTGALESLTNFRDPALIHRTLAYVISDQVRTQDATYLLAALLMHRGSRDLTWQFIRENWDRVKSRITPLAASRLVYATGSFCTTEARDQVTAFFNEHKVAAADRAMKQAVDSINRCVDLREHQEPKLKAWLASSSAE